MRPADTVLQCGLEMETSRNPMNQLVFQLTLRFPVFVFERQKLNLSDSNHNI